MATLAPGGRITLPIVAEEVARLRASWAEPASQASGALLEEILGGERVAQIDRFDRVQLAEVLRVCRAARSLSEAGRELFEVSRTRKSSSNDADRLRKYLARFGLSWESVHDADSGPAC